MIAILSAFTYQLQASKIVGNTTVFSIFQNRLLITLLFSRFLIFEGVSSYRIYISSTLTDFKIKQFLPLIPKGSCLIIIFPFRGQGVKKMKIIQ